MAHQTHIDSHQAAVAGLSVQKAGVGFDNGVVAALFLHQDIGDTARRITAGGDLMAVGIADAHEGIGLGIAGRFDNDKLVTADAGVAVGDPFGLGLIEAYGLGAPVQHDKIIAESVHFYKRQTVHNRPYMACWRGKSTFNRG